MSFSKWPLTTLCLSLFVAKFCFSWQPFDEVNRISENVKDQILSENISAGLVCYDNKYFQEFLSYANL